jgi:hypothetical protein
MDAKGDPTKDGQSISQDLDIKSWVINGIAKRDPAKSGQSISILI